MKAINKNTMIAGLVITALIMITGVSVYAQPWEGGGTEDDPYKISDADDLLDIGDVQNQQYLGSYFLQTADIDLGHIQNWEPIGDGNNHFTGVYDGNGYTISSLTIDNPISDYAGLFGYIDNATVKKVRLQEVVVSGHSFVGSLVGYNSNSLMDNCISSEGVIDAAGQYIGGLVGYNHAGDISESYTAANLSVMGDDYVGGLVGYNDGGYLFNCYSRSLVTGNDWVAGLVAKQSNGTVDHCYATGDVNGSRFTGGLIGYDGPTIRGTVTNSYWDEETTGQQYSGGGESRTTNQMTYPYDQNTYVGWGFDLTWREDTDHQLNDGYPVLWKSTLFAGGSGEEGDPYLIRIPWHLHNVRKYLDAHFKLIRDIDLGVPPWNDGEGWIPIGDAGDPFTGSFDGNEHTISDLTINRPDSDYQGLFGYIEGEEENRTNIENLRLEDFDITAFSKLGGLAGYSNFHTKIKEVFITESEINGAVNVGGLIGYSRSDIDNCSVSSVDILVRDVNINRQSIGGLVGVNYGIILNSYAKSCSITIEENQEYTVDKIGGLVGWSVSGSVISKCYAATNVEGGNNVGGLVGFNSGNVTMCYSTGIVTGEDETIGGLIGNMNFGELFNSYSTVTVDAHYENPSQIGGLIGLFYGGEVDSCYSVGLVMPQGEDVGGLIGYKAENLDIENSYWDVWTSGQEDSAGGEGKTTHEMMNKYTFDGWEFEYGLIMIDPPTAPWRNWSTTNLNPYVLKTYPYLSWQVNPGEHNFPEYEDAPSDSTHVKFFSEERLSHWDSFPRLEEYDNWPYTVELLDTLTICPDTGIEKVYKAHENYMEYMYDWHPPEWDPEDHVRFIRWKGYKLEFKDPEPPHEQRDWYLQVSGERLAPETPVSLEPNQQNWVGYFLPGTQPLWDAFESISDSVQYITGQDGGYYYCQVENVWSQPIDPPNVYYGKMYKIVLRPGVGGFNFNWDSIRGHNNLEGKDIFHRPKPEYFSYKDGHIYEEFFIESIENDRDIKEIGVFAGEECVGASVFNGEYPVSILAYTNETNPGSEISFVFYKGERQEPERVSMVYARCNITGEYTLQTLRPMQQIYTLVRVGEDDTRSGVATPQIVMSQNYPNPMVIGSSERDRTVRTRSAAGITTQIPLYIPQAMDVTITIYNIKGQKVREVVSGNIPAGEHRFEWNGKNERNQPVASGIYFYRLESDIETISKKMLIIR